MFLSKKNNIVLVGMGLAVLALFMGLLFAPRGDKNPQDLTPTVSPTLTATSTPTETPTPTVTDYPFTGMTATPSPTPELSATPLPTDSPTPELSDTPTPEPTATVTPEPTATVTPEPTSTPTKVPTKAPTATSTPTVTQKPATPTPTGKPATPTPTVTQKPATPTPTEVPATPTPKQPTPTPVTPTPKPTQAVSPSEWSRDNLPPGFDSEMAVLEYVANYEINHFVKPSLQKAGYSYVGYKIVSPGNTIDGWTAYNLEVTARNNEFDSVEIVTSSLVLGEYYAAILNGNVSGMYYRRVTDYYEGKKVGTAVDLDDAGFEAYLSTLY